MIHKDDLPMDVAEKIVEELKKMHPGCKSVVFAGDSPDTELQEKHKQITEQINKMHLKSFKEGECLDCGTKIPIPWPPKSDDFEWPKGWGRLEEVGNDDLCPALLCPTCYDETFPEEENDMA
jgi:hypothetical protein